MTATKKINLAEYKESKAATAVVVETDAGDFKILPPELWSEDANDLDPSDVRGLAAVALGSVEELDRFVAAGGSAVLVASIFKDTFGDVGESSASSR